MNSIRDFFTAQMETPTCFGPWHLVSIALTIVLTVLTIVFLRNCKDKTFRIVLAVAWAILLCFELYKQWIWNFSIYDCTAVGYCWYMFPFQFCSTPLYVLPLVTFLPEGKVRQAFMSFAAFFMIFGGIGVMAYPGDVFNSYVGINIQTMVHHGLQVVTGVFIGVWNRKALKNLFYLLKGAIVFSGFLAIAVLLNTILNNTFSDPAKYVNFFFISKEIPCGLPILSSIYPLVPHPVFILIYYAGFCLVASIIYALFYVFAYIIPNKVTHAKEKTC